MAAPGACAGDAGVAGAVEPESRLAQLIRPSLPVRHLIRPAERPTVFDLAARRVGFALGRDGRVAHPELVEVVFDTGIAVAAIGDYCAAPGRCAA